MQIDGLGEVVRSTVEETLNALLDAERPLVPCRAARTHRSPQGYASGFLRAAPTDESRRSHAKGAEATHLLLTSPMACCAASTDHHIARRLGFILFRDSSVHADGRGVLPGVPPVPVAANKNFCGFIGPVPGSALLPDVHQPAALTSHATGLSLAHLDSPIARCRPRAPEFRFPNVAAGYAEAYGAGLGIVGPPEPRGAYPAS